MKTRIYKLIGLMLLIVIAFSTTILSIYAKDNIAVVLDGTELTFDVPPQIINGRTMVPLRKIFESMGASVEWNNATQTVTATDGKNIVCATINNNTMKINGTPKSLDVVPQLIDGRTLVPARFVAEAFGATVDWDAATSTVIITSFDNIDGSFSHNPVNTSITLYAPDGRTIAVNESEVEAYKSVGWYTEPIVTMYAPDGRTLYVGESEVEAHKNVGWYSEPVVTMYAPDGRTLYVGESEVEAHKNVGWYNEPVVTMYAPDGRTLYVGESEVEAHKNVGWYETKYEATEASKPKTNPSSYNPSNDGYYYRTPYGKKYHLDPNCGGKNSYRISNTSGLSPCSKCAY